MNTSHYWQQRLRASAGAEKPAVGDEGGSLVHCLHTTMSQNKQTKLIISKHWWQANLSRPDLVTITKINSPAWPHCSNLRLLLKSSWPLHRSRSFIWKKWKTLLFSISRYARLQQTVFQNVPMFRSRLLLPWFLFFFFFFSRNIKDDKVFKKDFILHSHDWNVMNFRPTSASQITVSGYKSIQIDMFFARGT